MPTLLSEGTYQIRMAGRSAASVPLCADGRACARGQGKAILLDVAAAHLTVLQPMPDETVPVPAEHRRMNRRLVPGRAPQMLNRNWMPECRPFTALGHGTQASAARFFPTQCPTVFPGPCPSSGVTGTQPLCGAQGNPRFRQSAQIIPNNQTGMHLDP